MWVQYLGLILLRRIIYFLEREVCHTDFDVWCENILDRSRSSTFIGVFMLCEFQHKNTKYLSKCTSLLGGQDDNLFWFLYYKEHSGSNESLKVLLLTRHSLYSVILLVLDPRKYEYLKDYSLNFEHAYKTTYLAS